MKQVISRSIDLLFVLFIHERHLDMFNKMSFLHKMCEALYQGEVESFRACEFSCRVAEK